MAAGRSPALRGAAKKIVHGIELTEEIFMNSFP